MIDVHSNDGTDNSARQGRSTGGWLVRLCVVLLSLVAACAVAAAFLTAADIIVQGEWRDVPLAMMISADFLMRFLLVIVYAMPPALVIAAFSEFFGIRSAWLSAVAGVCIPGGCLLWSGRAFAYFNSFPPANEVAIYLLLTAAAGLVAGLAYWRMAGKNAGVWRSATTGGSVAVLSCTAIVVMLAVVMAPSAAGFYRLLFPADTDADWDSKVGWRLCNDAIAAWPKKAAPACWKLTLCDNEGGLSPAERRRLKDMMVETKCED